MREEYGERAVHSEIPPKEREANESLGKIRAEPLKKAPQLARPPNGRYRDCQ
jgi:hypothetical protein